MALLTGQSWCILNSWYTGEGPEKEFWHCFTDRLNQKFSSICGVLSGTAPIKYFTCHTNEVKLQKKITGDSLQMLLSHWLLKEDGCIIEVVELGGKSKWSS